MLVATFFDDKYRCKCYYHNASNWREHISIICNSWEIDGHFAIDCTVCGVTRLLFLCLFHRAGNDNDDDVFSGIVYHSYDNYYSYKPFPIHLPCNLERPIFMWTFPTMFCVNAAKKGYASHLTVLGEHCSSILVLGQERMVVHLSTPFAKIPFTFAG